jgi:hypothetical protein
MRYFIPVMFVFLIGCSSDNRIQTLVDQADVIRTVNTLFVKTDNRDWEAVKDVFADTVMFDMTSMTGGEPSRLSAQQIVDGWEQGLKPLKAIHHQVGNHLVTVRGSEADAFCYGVASHYLPNPSNQNTRTFVGSYDFHLMRTGGSWKIDRFIFNLKYVEGNLSLTAHAE